MSLAAFRSVPEQQELANLAEEHLKHDLDAEDREVLKSAASRVSLHATLGSLLGLGLGIYLAYRVRKVRLDVFNAFRAAEKPVQVMFANGRTESLPDMTSMIRPTRYGDIAAYCFFGLGGLFVGGESGFLTGTWSASRKLKQNPEKLRKIEGAYRNFKADLLRKELDRLEGGEPIWK